MQALCPSRAGPRHMPDDRDADALEYTRGGIGRQHDRLARGSVRRRVGCSAAVGVAPACMPLSSLRFELLEAQALRAGLTASAASRSASENFSTTGLPARSCIAAARFSIARMVAALSEPPTIWPSSAQHPFAVLAGDAAEQRAGAVAQLGVGLDRRSRGPTAGAALAGALLLVGVALGFRLDRHVGPPFSGGGHGVRGVAIRPPPPPPRLDPSPPPDPPPPPPPPILARIGDGGEVDWSHRMQVVRSHPGDLRSTHAGAAGSSSRPMPLSTLFASYRGLRFIRCPEARRDALQSCLFAMLRRVARLTRYCRRPAWSGVVPIPVRREFCHVVRFSWPRRARPTLAPALRPGAGRRRRGGRPGAVAPPVLGAAPYGPPNVLSGTHYST